MKIGTALFTWHRSEHAKKVLEALANNTVLPEKLYIFQDGISDKADYEEWQKVNRLIKTVDFCETAIVVSGTNKGCRRSIVSGINHVLSECDAVIVLEDDCLPSCQYMNYMVSALKTYQGSSKVYSVSGYALDVVLLDQQGDAYFNGRSCSYGWGTWRDKWEAYEENYNIVNEIKKNPETKLSLKTWGNDLEEMLAGNIYGYCDAWDVFWSLNIIKRGGFCLSPYKTLIRNIGFDGSGLHCGSSIYFQNMERTREFDDKGAFCFPSKVECTKECEEEFRFLYGGKPEKEKRKLYRQLFIRWIMMKQNGRKINLPQELMGNVAFWGKGRVFDLLLAELDGQQICAGYIVESRPNDTVYSGIPVIPLEQLPQTIKNIIVIPFFDIDIIVPRVKKLRPDVRLWGIDALIL